MPTSTLTRRSALHTLALWGAANGLPSFTWAQGTAQAPEPLSAKAQAWRALSRLGYGPTPALLQAVQQAASPRLWALQQVDAAYAASQQAPRITPGLEQFNAPLPQLFDAFQQERTARKDKQDAPPRDATASSDPAFFSRKVAQQAALWRLDSCSQPAVENPLLARMTEFWFNHLNVFAGKAAVRPFVGHYLINVARAHALGKFEDLLLASARHPAMLFYLDQVQSVAEGTRGAQGQTRGLNENYARELMELHTLGVNGGYTQTDVRALARILTGWTVGANDASGFRFAPRMHDTADKQLLGRTFPSDFTRRGEAEGWDAIRLLARHPATAHRVCQRLAHFFIADYAQPTLLKRLKGIFLETHGDIRAVLRGLIESPEFWQADNRLFKTPLDYACSALTAKRSVSNDSDMDRRDLVLTLGFLNQAGQPLHGWQTPDGYAFDAATWLAPEALTRRADYALALARQTPELEFLQPFFGAATLGAIAQERPAMRAGLMLAAPEFMYK